MAESVDALVSNTSGVTSIPVRPRVWVRRKSAEYFITNTQPISFYYFILHILIQTNRKVRA